MLDKMALSLYRAYWSAKLRLMKLGQEEDGMETLETVILIAVAVVIAGAVVGILDNNGNGFIKDLFDAIRTAIGDKIGIKF